MIKLSALVGLVAALGLGACGATTSSTSQNYPNMARRAAPAHVTTVVASALTHSQEASPEAR